MPKMYRGKALATADRALNVGDTDTFSVIIKRNNAVVDITGAKAEFIITSKATAIELDNTLQPTQVVVDGPAGKITVNVLSADTAAKTPGLYTYELRARIPGLPEVKTLYGGDYDLRAATAQLPA